MDRKEVTQKVIEKIQKLLALANSSNEHEAKLAAERASTLLTKHNLSMQDVELSEREYASVHYMGNGVRQTLEQKFLFEIVGTYFFVQVVVGKKFSLKTCKRHFVWSFFGQQHNVEIAQYVYRFLDKAFHELYDKHQKLSGCSGVRARNSFYLGLKHGISSQLRKVKEEVQTETGLVVVPDAHLDDFIEQQVGKTSNVPSKKVYWVESAAYNKGMEEGKNLKIAASIENNSGSEGPTKLIDSKKP